VLQEKVVAAKDGGRNDDIGVNRPVRQFEFSREDVTPPFGFAAGIFVADQHRRIDFFKEFFEGVVGVAAEHEANATLACVFFYIAQALLEKVIVAEIGVGVIGNDGKEYDYGQAEKICDVNGNIERRVLVDAHGPLHPVDDTFGGWL
jgi:hypothetical protein